MVAMVIAGFSVYCAHARRPSVDGGHSTAVRVIVPGVVAATMDFLLPQHFAHSFADGVVDHDIHYAGES